MEIDASAVLASHCTACNAQTRGLTAPNAKVIISLSMVFAKAAQTSSRIAKFAVQAKFAAPARKVSTLIPVKNVINAYYIAPLAKMKTYAPHAIQASTSTAMEMPA